MRIRVAFALAAVAACVSSPAYSQWRVGQEREVDEGYYLKLLKVSKGWRLWQVETKDGKSCIAIKSAKGRPHPEPVGVAAGFYGGTPFLTVSKGYQGKISYNWQGDHLSGERTKIREIGGRFWDDWSYNTDLSPRDGELIEVNIVTYEYPEIYVGRSEENAIMDLTGLNEISSEVLSCGATS